MKQQILIIYAKGTDEIFNRQSALGSYIYCLAGILVKNGYQVRINDVDFDSALIQRSVSVVNKKQSHIKAIIPLFVKEFVKDRKLFTRLRTFFAVIDNGKSFDKILEFYTYGSDIGLRLSVKYKKPLVLVYDNPVLEEHTFFNPGQLFFKNKIKRREENSLLGAESIIVYSDAVRMYLHKRLKRPMPCFIHQNVDYTRFEYVENKAASDTVNIGFIGSFLKWHRVDILVRAFTTLKDEGFNIRLFLLGNGMDYDRIYEQVQGSKYASDIEMPGFLDGQNLLAYKEKLHIGIMPGSNWYGAPNKIFEYGAAGMAVVAPNTPTIESLFNDKKDLLLFKQDNEKDLTDKIRTCLQDPLLLSALAAQLQLKIRRTYSENITFDFYNQLLRK